MNPSTAFARVLVDELVRGGVTEAVLSPGSRSAPLAFALYDADQAGRLRLHVRIDERSASFLALGLAKVTGRPVPVVTTSGTAVANLHPAVLEASHAGVPLLLLTADRPPELRGTGANQTVDQVGIYGGAVRLAVDVGTPDERAGQVSYWRGLTCRALAAAAGDLGGEPGPVHLNLGLREPLVPDGGEEGGSLAGRADGSPWTERVAVSTIQVVDDLPDRTVVVLGDCPPAWAAAALRLAGARGWPVVAEPSASAWAPEVVLPVAEPLLGVPDFVAARRPDRVLVVGRTTLSRAVGALVAGSPSDIVGGHGAWPDVSRTASRALPAVPTPSGGPVDAGWLPSWTEPAARAAEAVDRLLAQGPLTEPVVAREVLGSRASLLVVGSSKPVRDLFLAGSREGLRVLANRGAAGIDGAVSTAVGAALAAGTPTVALLGDLTFLHDANGLVLGPDEPRPDLTIVVVNNDGGAIFGLLEQGATQHAAVFERIFGTPHGVQLTALCAATGTSHQLVNDREQLRAALEGGGLRVVEVRSSRAEAVEVDRAVRTAITAAVS